MESHPASLQGLIHDGWGAPVESPWDGIKTAFRSTGPDRKLYREYNIIQMSWENLMDYTAINLLEKLDKFSEHWAPKIIARMNDYHFKLVKFKGDFVWHSHEDTDEVFIVLAGEMSIEFRDGTVDLKAGEMYVVPRKVEHKPFAESECQIMLVEPAGTVNTGDAGGDMTSEALWV